MAKMTEETKVKVREAMRHPVKWLKSDHLPEEEIRPWEYGNDCRPDTERPVRWLHRDDRQGVQRYGRGHGPSHLDELPVQLVLYNTYKQDLTDYVNAY